LALELKLGEQKEAILEMSTLPGLEHMIITIDRFMEQKLEQAEEETLVEQKLLGQEHMIHQSL